MKSPLNKRASFFSSSFIERNNRYRSGFEAKLKDVGGTFWVLMALWSWVLKTSSKQHSKH
jgi:hypothetical protein